MLARFTDSARHALIRAGTLTLDAGRPALTPDLLLLALAEIRPFSLDGFTMTAEDVRGQVDLGDRRELLATLGIDLAEVHRRTRVGTSDPPRWRLTRSRLNPLRVTLNGP